MIQLLQRFHEAGVRYLLIGGQAMRLAGMPRFSMDWDVFIPPRDLPNIERINQLLGDHLDLPLVSLGEHGENFLQTYQLENGVLQFHLLIPGIASFDEAYGRRVMHEEEGRAVPCLSPADLLVAKLRANRPEDQMDIAFLERKLS